MMLEKYSIIFIVSMFFCCSLCSNEVKESWYKHSQWVDNFKCRIPQARSFELTELLNHNDSLLLHVENVYPSMTVLHRCDNAGCCPGIKTCAPKESEVVNLIFGIVQPGLSKIQYVYRDVINHTSCACEIKRKQ